MEKSTEKTENAQDVRMQARGDVSAYIKIAQNATADRHGMITIAKGAPMIVDPTTRECMPANAKNIEKFRRNGMSFHTKPCREMKDRLAAMQDCARRFGSALDVNTEDLKGVLIPEQFLPWYLKLLPYPFRISFRKRRELKVQQIDFIKYLEEHEIIPRQRNVAPEVWEDIANSNQFRIYEVVGWGIVFHIYALYVTHIAEKDENGTRRLAIKPVDTRTYKAIASFVKEQKQKYRRANCQCLSIGSFGGFAGVSDIELNDKIQVLSSPVKPTMETWNTRHASIEHMPAVYRTIFYRLYPETQREWHGRICKVLAKESFATTMTIGKMAKTTGIPRDAVADVFEKLRQSGYQWRSVRNSATKELGIAPKESSPDAGTFLQKRNWPVRAVSVLGTFTALGTPILSRFVFVKFEQRDIFGVIAGLVMLWAFLAIANAIKRRTNS